MAAEESSPQVFAPASIEGPAIIQDPEYPFPDAETRANGAAKIAELITRVIRGSLVSITNRGSAKRPASEVWLSRAQWFSNPREPGTHGQAVKVLYFNDILRAFCGDQAAKHARREFLESIMADAVEEAMKPDLPEANN